MSKEDHFQDLSISGIFSLGANASIQNASKVSIDSLFSGILNGVRVVTSETFPTLQDAHDDLTSDGGMILVPPTGLSISSNFTVTKNNVYIVCAGQGGTTGSALKDGAAVLTWTGPAGGTMIRWGNQADHIIGGGIIGLELNGGALASKLLHITDAQHFSFENLYLRNLRTNSGDEGITLDNNLASANPTGKGSFKNVMVDVGGSSGSANCVGIRGTSGTGVYGIVWDNFRCIHYDGTGVLITLGDGMTWVNPQIFRGSGGSGQGFDIRPAAASDPVSGHVLISPVVTGGVRVETSGAEALDSTQQLTILHYGTVDSGNITGAGVGSNVVALLDDGTWEGRSQKFTGGLEVGSSNAFVRSGTGQANFTGSGLTQFTGADVNLQNGISLIGYSDGASTQKIKLNMSDGAGTFAGAVEIDGDLNHDGSNAGFYGTAPASQASAEAALTGTPGTADGAMATISGSGDDANINNNFQEVQDKVNAALAALRGVGLIAT